MHAHAQRNAGKCILNDAGAKHGAGLAAQNHIGALTVAVDKDRCKGKLLLQGGANLCFIGQAVAVHNKAEQPLAAVPALPHVEMPHTAGVRFLVVGSDAVFLKQRTGACGQLVHPLRL